MRWLDALLELLYPTRCVFCHRLTSNHSEPICARCRQTLPLVPIAAQKQQFPNLTACVSPLYYTGSVRESLHRFKFGGLAFYAENYADFVVKCIDENKITCDSITWAPLSRQRLRKRGYDRARLLAEEISTRTGLPCERTLVKLRNNPPQSRTKKAADRKANVAGAYGPAANARISGRRWLLVDDIVTTGSTLSECAGVLRSAGATEVTAATVARAR